MQTRETFRQLLQWLLLYSVGRVTCSHRWNCRVSVQSFGRATEPGCVVQGFERAPKCRLQGVSLEACARTTFVQRAL